MLNDALRVFRSYHGLSQSDLAERLDISPSYLSELESGRKQVTLQILEKYSQSFDLPISSILLFSENIEDGSIAGKFKTAAAKKVVSILQWAESTGVLSTADRMK